MATLDEKWPLARTRHRCGSCNGIIEPGERYLRWKGTSDYWEGVATLKECQSCSKRYGRTQPEALRSVADRIERGEGT